MVGASGGVALSYDPLGRLYQVSSTAGPTTTFLYDGDALVAEYEGATLLRRHVHNVGADVPIVTYEGVDFSNPRFLFADHQGSIVTWSSASGAVLGINSYDEYGIPGAANLGRFQYTGQMWLDELGMYYYKARIYSPTLGRFLQTDPVGYADQFNLYAYVGNDPVNATDPTGESTTYWRSPTEAHVVMDLRMVADTTNLAQNQQPQQFSFTGAQLSRYVETAIQGPTNYEGRTVNMTTSVNIVGPGEGGADAWTMYQHSRENFPSSGNGSAQSWADPTTLSIHLSYLPGLERLPIAAHEVGHGFGAWGQRAGDAGPNGRLPLGNYETGLMNFGQAVTNDQTRGEILRSPLNRNVYLFDEGRPR